MYGNTHIMEVYETMKTQQLDGLGPQRLGDRCWWGGSARGTCLETDLNQVDGSLMTQQNGGLIDNYRV